MEDKTRFKYAIVRVKESSVVDFFGLIASNGYSDVSFVSNLSQAIARSDPNDDGESSSSNKDDRVADSEDRCSMTGTPQSPPTEDLKLQSNLSSQLALICKESSPVFNGTDVTDIVNATSSDLISNLFATHTIPFNTKDWNSAMEAAGGPMRITKQQTTPLQFQTRMKGWQREYIKDIINNGHYPTEDELRDIEHKCDLSRKQVLRFIAKRLVNPNRKPRADWRSDRAADVAAANTSGVSVKAEPLMETVPSA